MPGGWQNPFGPKALDDGSDLWRDVGEEEPLLPWMSAVNKIQDKGMRRFLSSTEAFNDFYRRFQGEMWDDPTAMFQDKLNPQNLMNFGYSYAPQQRGIDMNRFAPSLRYQF